MAVIGKIREKSTLLLIIIGGALMAFILTDLFSSRSSVFSSDMENIGTIDGVNIKGVEFNKRFELELETFKARENRSDVPEFVQGQLREQVWNQYLNDMILGKQLEELGITVSSEELADMTYGDNPHDQVKQAFTNPNTGQFNKNDVINFLKNLESDETGKTKKQWLDFETAVKAERRSKKYYNLIQKGLYATNAEAAEFYQAQNKRMNISYVVKRYTDLNDSLVDVSESDIKKYYKSHPEKFTEKKSRKIEYAIFRVLPSSRDSAEVKEWVDDTYARFLKTKDDSSFVNSNSDKEFNARYYSKNSESIPFDTALFNQDSANFVVAPFIEGENWKMLKISRIKESPDSVKAQHILLSFTADNKVKIQAQLDSLKLAIEGGADFGQLAKTFTADQGSKEDNGNLGWFQEGFMIPVINDSCFKAELNKMMIVESPFGLHLLQVTEKSPVVKKLQVAIITRAIDASRETIDKEFTASNDFSVQAENGADFQELSDNFLVDHNVIDVRENDNMIPEIESTRGVIRWAYEAELNAVSEAMEFNGAFVVIKLLEIHDDGVAPFDRVRDEAELGAIKDKKAEKFISEMQGITSLSDAASKLNLQIEQASEVIFESYSIPGMGREPNLLGKIFTMNTADLSVPIKGENGVFIVHIDKIDEPAAQSDHTITKRQITQTRSSRVDFEVFESLKKLANVEDNRYRFY